MENLEKMIMWMVIVFLLMLQVVQVVQVSDMHDTLSLYDIDKTEYCITNIRW